MGVMTRPWGSQGGTLPPLQRTPGHCTTLYSLLLSQLRVVHRSGVQCTDSAGPNDWVEGPLCMHTGAGTHSTNPIPTIPATRPPLPDLALQAATADPVHPPFNFSITTKILSDVSNILSRLTTPGEDWLKLHTKVHPRTGVVQVLQYRNFILQCGLLLGGEPHLVDDFNGHGAAGDPVTQVVAQCGSGT